MLTRMSACHKVNQQSVLKPLLHQGISDCVTWSLVIHFTALFPPLATHTCDYYFVWTLHHAFSALFMAGNYRFYCLLLFRFCLNILNETSGGFWALKGHRFTLMLYELWVYFTILLDANPTDLQYLFLPYLESFISAFWGQSSCVESNHPQRLPLNIDAVVGQHQI